MIQTLILSRLPSRLFLLLFFTRPGEELTRPYSHFESHRVRRLQYETADSNALCLTSHLLAYSFLDSRGRAARPLDRHLLSGKKRRRARV